MILVSVFVDNETAPLSSDRILHTVACDKVVI
jgi:hypothetical protein